MLERKLLHPPVDDILDALTRAQTAVFGPRPAGRIDDFFVSNRGKGELEAELNEFGQWIETASQEGYPDIWKAIVGTIAWRIESLLVNYPDDVRSGFETCLLEILTR